MNNNSTNATVPFNGYLPGFAEKVAVVIMYTSISLVALVGNTIVIYIILYFRVLRTPTNLLIANLALADTLMAVFCIPFSFWPILILQYWPFGVFLCKFLTFVKAATVYLSSYTLVAISFDRFLAVVFPFKSVFRMRHEGAIMVILVVWAIACVIAGPTLYLINATGNPVQCEERWEEDLSIAYSYINLALQYFFPVFVLIITYSAIVVNIWRTRVTRERDTVMQESELKERKDSVKKMIPMMILVTSLYAICWFPLNLLMNVLVPIYGEELTEHPMILYIWWACHFSAMSHSMVNPIIYVARNKRFREGFKFTFHWIPGIRFTGKHLLERDRYLFSTNGGSFRQTSLDTLDNNVGSSKRNRIRNCGYSESETFSSLITEAQCNNSNRRKSVMSEPPIFEEADIVQICDNE